MMMLAMIAFMCVGFAACGGDDDDESGRKSVTEGKTDGEKDSDQPLTGRQAVDLGLPSGLKWANMNVGAEKETDYGLYFAWGEIKGYATQENPTVINDVTVDHVFNWENYKWFYVIIVSKYNETDEKTQLISSDDAARANWGGSWRMPTGAEFHELIKNTDNKWTTINGVNGYKFTNKSDASKYIFLPATGICSMSNCWGQNEYGNYWSSVRQSDPTNAYSLYIVKGGVSVLFEERCKGFSIRPVQ